MKREPSLRERKKLATRAALSRAAWSLMVERGLDAATPEAIAAEVNVSPRTFRNYFASREEAILYSLAQTGPGLLDALRARPVEEPPWDSLTQVLPAFAAAFADQRHIIGSLLRVVDEDPSMRAQHLVTYERIDRQLAELIAERIGAEVRRDLTPRLLAAAAAAVLQTSIEMWARGDRDLALPDLVREGLVEVRAGLPAGAAVRVSSPSPAG
ncbi:TetR/AcrR family transcriptional regulator [Streptomyces sp. NPDC058307]|uniref:TetR/AcrR family transcriptional regulator n=1 Tax=Streptomyces sp. NPDC058307 TaxID=3346439 RepID=UPI0036EE83E3